MQTKPQLNFYLKELKLPVDSAYVTENANPTSVLVRIAINQLLKEYLPKPPSESTLVVFYARFEKLSVNIT